MDDGVPGIPEAIPLERTALEKGQLLLAITDTEEPAGMVAGNAMLQVLDVPVTVAPGTEVVQV